MVPLVSPCTSGSRTVGGSWSGGKRGGGASGAGAMGDFTTVTSDALHCCDGSRTSTLCLGGVTSSHEGSDSTEELGGFAPSAAALDGPSEKGTTEMGTSEKGASLEAS